LIAIVEILVAMLLVLVVLSVIVFTLDLSRFDDQAICQLPDHQHASESLE